MAVIKRVISNPDQTGREKKISRTAMEMDNERDDGAVTTRATRVKGLILPAHEIHEEHAQQKIHIIQGAEGNTHDVDVGGNGNTQSPPARSNSSNDSSSCTVDDGRSSTTTIKHSNYYNDQTVDVDGEMSNMIRQISVDSNTPNPTPTPNILPPANTVTNTIVNFNANANARLSTNMNTKPYLLSTHATRTTNARASPRQLRPFANPQTHVHRRIHLKAATQKHDSVMENSSGYGATRDWGWFEDVHENEGGKESESQRSKETAIGANGSQASHEKKQVTFDKKGHPEKQMMAVTAPTYVLEESRSSQKLWKQTAGTRPPQPVEERAFFEKIWAQNFKKSHVDYQIPSDVLTATSPVALSPFADGNFMAGANGYSSLVGTVSRASDAHTEAEALSSIATATKSEYGSSRSKNLQTLGPHDHHHTLVNKKVKKDDGTDDELLTVVVRGDNVFGTTVSKSFPGPDQRQGEVVTVSISVASYRVVESKAHGKYAQFLVIFCEGTFRDTVGVWKRYSDFDKLSKSVTNSPESCTSVLAGINPLAITDDPHDHEEMPNARTSWKLLQKRKRWFRCLDAGYLSLKAFLLERFLHDVLFESRNPNILRDFVDSGDDVLGNS